MLVKWISIILLLPINNTIEHDWNGAYTLIHTRVILADDGVAVASKRAARSTEVMKVFSSKFPSVHFPRRVYANAHPAIIPFSRLISPSLSCSSSLSFSAHLLSLSLTLYLFFSFSLTMYV